MPLDLAAIRARHEPYADTRVGADIAALLSEVEAQQEEIRRLTAALAAARPVAEWRTMLDGRTGDVTTHAAEVGAAALRVAEKQWRARSFPGWKGDKPGWAVVFGMKYVAASGPETGDAGKAACYAAYMRACGL